MAPLIRMTWTEMRDEVQLRMGKQNVTDWTPRMERFLTAAYYDIAMTFHQYQLESIVELTVLEDADLVSWGSDPAVIYPNGEIYSIMGARLRDDDGVPYQLTQENIRFTFNERREKGRPERWARTTPKSLLLDRPSNQDYFVDVYAYVYPPPPDFVAPVPSVLDQLWDEHIMQRAMFLAAPATWRYDMSQVQVQTLQEFLQAQPQLPTKGSLVARAEVPLTSQNTGGSQ